MILFFLAALLGAGNIYEGRVVRVIDGDSIVVRVAIWPGIETTASIRLRGVDTPELRGKCEAEKVLARKAKAFTAELLPAGAAVILSNLKPDKYGGRFDADVATSGGAALSQSLIAAGLAREYNGERRAGWCAVTLRGE